MAKVKIQGNAAGSGVFTVTAPISNTNRTLTLPDTTGTLLDENSSVPAANLTGTVADARISALTSSKLTGNLPALNASSLTNIPAANITGTLPAISGASLTSLPIQNRPSAKPIIINGDMQVAQRGTSGSVPDSGGEAYSADRYTFQAGGIGVYATTQESLTSGAAFNAGFKKASRIDCTTAVASPAGGDYFYFQHMIEAQDCLPFKKGTSNAETMTVAFWVKSNKTGTSQLTVKDGDNDRICAGTYAISVADTWEHKVINIAADTSGAMNNDNGRGFIFEWWLGGGTSYTSGTAPTAWEARADADRGANNLAINDNTANDWAITGIQVEVGTYTSATLPPFQFEGYGDNLARCRRYFQAYYITQHAPLCVDWMGGSNAGNMRGTLYFDTPMRAAPTQGFLGSCGWYEQNTNTNAPQSLWFTTTGMIAYNDQGANIFGDSADDAITFTSEL